jgi:non-reducing end alpha-L-arabinofuranosidase
MRPVSAVSSLVPGSAILLRATTPGSTGECLRHREGRALISPIGKDSPILDVHDATWIVRVGLAERSLLSFESKNYPGSYLRHRNAAVYADHSDGSEQFAADATFAPEPGKNGQGVSLAAYNYPTRYMRHWAGEIFIADEGGPEPWESAKAWADDVSWLPTPAWAL